ncbi:MAG: rRNA maturation RNase YbeY [Aquificota bacterium]|nr:MAG: rRNA maturation RNase YbeY [Aquificota bacterium]
MRSLKGQRKSRVLLRNESKRLSSRWIKDLANRIIQALGLELCEVSIYITTDEVIRELNRKYRGKDKPTDVLSFPFGERVGKYTLLGEIVLSEQTAQRQAQELNHSLEEEVKRLLVHGFVHLMGYDHEASPEEERRFKEIEERVLSLI